MWSFCVRPSSYISAVGFGQCSDWGFVCGLLKVPELTCELRSCELMVLLSFCLLWTSSVFWIKIASVFTVFVLELNSQAFFNLILYLSYANSNWHYKVLFHQSRPLCIFITQHFGCFRKKKSFQMRESAISDV